MLVRMGIKNFALIEHIQLEFSKGITIFTGETGSGKSILMDAFSILLGERGSVEFIRHGTESFTIEGLFDITGNLPLLDILKEKHIEVEEDMLVLSRTFNSQGKSAIFANDQLIPLKTLRQIGSYLADIHGQYSNQQLLLPETHHIYLDTFTDEAKSVYEAYKKAYESFKEAKYALDHSRERSAERAREIDMLQFQIEEIEEAQLEVGEDVNVAEELERMDNFEHLHSISSQVYDGIYHGRTPLIDMLNSVQSEISDLVSYDKDMEEIAELLTSSYFQLEEAGQAIGRYKDQISYDEERYYYLQERDTLIYGLKRKYGETIEDILEYERTAQERLDALEEEKSEENDLEGRLASAKELALTAMKQLQEVRKKNHHSITNALQENLKRLGMEKAQLLFNIDESTDLTPLGADGIELLFSANTGEALLPLHKVASGGELARIALAFKSVFSQSSNKTLVFDEIDVGISGDIAIQVAWQILNLSKENQVFCITHLPQTASIAEQHYHLSKQEVDGRTISSVQILCHEEHIHQIARMMSGESFSDTAVETAKEMVQYFQNKA